MHKILLIVFLGVAVAHADVTYTYTGSDFIQTTGTGGPTTSDFISLSFVLPSALPDDVSNYGFSTISWTMSDGVNTVFSQNGDTSQAGDAFDTSVTTDALGNIIHWDFQGIGPSFSVELVTFDPPYFCCPGPYDHSATYFGPYGLSSPPTSTASTNSFEGFAQGIAGTWVVTSEVPEPAELWLFLVSLAACGAFVGNKFKRKI